MAFDLSTAQPVNNTPGQEIKPSGQFDIESARPVFTTGGDKDPQSPYNEFSQSERDTMQMSAEAKNKVPDTQPGKDLRPELAAASKYPTHSFLNHPVAALGDLAHLSADEVYNTFSKPLKLDPEASSTADEEISQISKDHPIGAILAGTAPFIATAPLFPARMFAFAGKLAGLTSMSSQFAAVAGLNAVGHVRMDESLMKPAGDKALEVARETSKGALMGPIWHYSPGLQYIGRPIAAALIRAGVRGAGTAALDKVYGDDLTSAFKDGGTMTAISLIFEMPGLARTMLGRGLINHANDVRADMMVKTGLPDQEIAPDNIARDPSGKPIEINPTPERRIDTQDVPIKKRLSDWTNIIDQFPTDEAKMHHIAKLPIDDAIKGRLMVHYGLGAGSPRINPEETDPEVLKKQILNTVNDLGSNLKGKNERYIDGKLHVLQDDGTYKDISTPEPPPSLGVRTLYQGAGRPKSQIYAQVEYPVAGKGSYYAFDEQTARKYGDTISKKNLNISKFLVINNDEEWRALTKEAGNKYPNPTGMSKEDSIQWSENIKEKVLDKGFKGLVVHVPEQESNGKTLQNVMGHSQVVDYSPPDANVEQSMAMDETPKIVNKQTLKDLSKGIEGEEGKMDVRLIPGLVEVSEGLSRAAKEYVENLEPTTVSNAAEFTSSDLRERLGRQAQLLDRLEVLLTGARKLFDKATKESITETYTKAERGEKQDTPELQQAYDSLQFILASTRDRVRVLGKGKLENAIDNYLAHIWEDPKKANLISRFFARRPFEGSKSFLKKRTIENFADGIEAGLTPVSWNPVDLTLLKVREMEKYILAHSALKANVANKFAKYVRIGSQAPDGWQKINDNISQVLKSPYTEVKEFFDEKVMNSLNKTAKGLGIDVDRLLKFKGGSRMEGVAGYSKIGRPGAPGTHEDPLLNTSGTKRYPDEVRTKFATPESVLAHEIGHQIDNMFNLKEIFLKDPRLTKELRSLADLRYEGKDPSQSFKNYVRKGSEKMAVMLEAYIHAPEKFKEVAPQAYKLFQDVLSRDERLSPLLEIKPSLVLGSGKADVYAGGIVIAGHYYAHPDTARIFNNYLSPGLRGKWLYDVYRTAGNSLVQFRLGISAFHAGFTTLDATISKFSKALNRLFRGDLKGFFLETAKTPFNPVLNFIEGRKLFQSWFGTDNGPLINTLAEAYAMGGGRARMDKFYATQFEQSMSKALKEGKLLTAALQTPFWLTQQMSRLLMEYLVPRQKMGVFADLMKMEIEDNPNMSHEQMRAVAQRIVNSVDNRMGQLVYDNLMINRTMKDLGMASVQSLGWNIGSVREIGGGVVDLAKTLNDLRHGRPTSVSYRTAYIMALPMVVGLYGAIYQYLHTGLWPGQTDTPSKDYFHPRTGGLDKNGLPARVNLPSYMKDIGSFMQDPAQTAINKLNPVNSELIQMWQNKDYFGTEIRNPDDPWVQQALDALKFVGGGFEPYSFENLNRDTRGDLASKIEPFVGITPARYDIDMTKAEKAALELEKGHIPQGARTKEAAAHSKAKSDLRNQYLVSGDEQPLKDAVAAGTITSKEKREIIKQKNMSRIQRLTQHLDADEVLSLIPKAESDEEREELEKIAKKKVSNKRGAGTWTQQDQELFNKFMPENDK